MAYRSWITCSFPTHIIFRYHLPLNVVITFRLTREEALQKWKKIYYTRLQAFVKDALQSQVDQIPCAFSWFLLQYNRYIRSFINIRWGPSPYRHSCRLSGRNLHGVPSRDSNSGLTAMHCMHYQLSNAAPIFIPFIKTLDSMLLGLLHLLYNKFFASCAARKWNFRNFFKNFTER